MGLKVPATLMSGVWKVGCTCRVYFAPSVWRVFISGRPKFGAKIGAGEVLAVDFSA